MPSASTGQPVIQQSVPMAECKWVNTVTPCTRASTYLLTRITQQRVREQWWNLLWTEPVACHRAPSGGAKVLRTSENYVTGIVHKAKRRSCMFAYLYALAKAKELGTLGGRVQSWYKRCKESAIIHSTQKRPGHDIHPSYADVLERDVSNR